MTKIRKNNRGVTLIELMIALAILAMIMTAVIMLMSNNSVVYRKTKADINVQTTAQETYSALQDAVMQATEITIKGYTSKAEAWADHEEDEDAPAYAKIKAEGSDITTFAELSADTELYPTEMTVKYSVKSKNTSKKNEMCTATFYFVRYNLDNDPRYESGAPRCNIYVTKDYEDGSGKEDDVWGTSVPAPTKSNMNEGNKDIYESHLLTSSLSEVFFKINAADQAINMDLSFNDKNMTYHTEGIVGIRNSYVLKEKPVRKNSTNPVDNP